MTAGAALQSGLIVANHGRHFLVETPSGQRIICHSRGKKSQGVVGDKVWWLASRDEGTIEKIEPRRNLFYRRDEIRTKSFAANLDLVLILIAAEPAFSNQQLSRALIAAEAEGITPLIVLNKRDLVEPFAHAWEWLAPYRAMGYQVIPVALKQPGGPEPTELIDLLQGRTTLVLGPSGMGKSTLINLLVPQAAAQVGEISQALNTGRHTTTSTRWYWLDDVLAAEGAGHRPRAALIDSPGFQEFGLRQVQPEQLAGLMPDYAAALGHCRFHNCSHRHEPGCGVREAAARGEISPTRQRIYGELFDELSQKRW